MAFKRVTPVTDAQRPQQPMSEKPLGTLLAKDAAADAAAAAERAAADPARRSVAAEVAAEIDKTKVIVDFVTSVVDDRVKDVAVTVDPETNPEVWMAMKRLYGDTASTTLTGLHYCRILDALAECGRLSYEEADAGAADEAAFVARATEAAR